MPELVQLKINGVSVQVPRGSNVAAAVLLAGHSGFRRSVSGELRGPLCGMGICFECRVAVDGQQHVRSCQLLCREGMEVTLHE
ncbi:MAG TPA: (2Fe-2S)-binding protein [Terriglobales bacterium]|nr:(2Fe-2S)-binding protein [Terriglobales bacterium]